MQENHYLVPQQEAGHQRDVQHDVVTETVDDAEYAFVDAKDRLLDINNWNKYCSELHTEFRLTDKHGLGIGRHAHKGDLIRMKMSGSKMHYQWVSVEAIEYDDYPDLQMESFAVRVRATDDPLHAKDSHNDYNLYKSGTFTFVIERRGAKLFSSFHGRNGVAISEGVADSEWRQLVACFLTT